jgi:hypothetical protein
MNVAPIIAGATSLTAVGALSYAGVEVGRALQHDKAPPGIPIGFGLAGALVGTMAGVVVAGATRSNSAYVAAAALGLSLGSVGFGTSMIAGYAIGRPENHRAYQR